MAFALGALWAALAALALATAGGVQGAGQTRGRAPVWAKRGPSRGLSAAPPRRPLPLDPASALSLPARPPAAAATATAAAAAAPPTLPPPARPPAAALTLEDYRSKNVVLFISDQERATQHFPVGWEAKNMPATTALKRNGLTFDRAFTAACMCSPARATLFTGLMPAQHGVRFTLEDDMNANIYSQVELNTELASLATLMSDAGYDVVYKGKWHLSKPTEKNRTDDNNRGWVPQDVGQYGWTRWNPADAGANQDLDQAGGGDCADTGCNDLVSLAYLIGQLSRKHVQNPNRSQPTNSPPPIPTAAPN
jgi:hypothetical protein